MRNRGVAYFTQFSNLNLPSVSEPLNADFDLQHFQIESHAAVSTD